MDLYNDFQEYAVRHMGVSSMQLHYWEKQQEAIYNKLTVTDSLTPYILEEREMRATQMDIFSRLMMERIVWLGGVVNDRMSTVAQAQLQFLENTDDADITFYIDSPGGSVKSGLSIVDMMEYIKPDIRTVNTGMAASMGSILLGAGTKGKRATLRHSRVMLHQVSGGAQGVLADMKISLAEAEKYNTELFRLLGEYTDKDPEQVMSDATRDFWLTGQEAVDYGIVDEVLMSKK